MATKLEDFPLYADLDYQHTIRNQSGALDDLSVYDGYVVHWFWKDAKGNRTVFAMYSKNAVTNYDQHLEAIDEPNGLAVSHIQKEDNVDIPNGSRMFWQLYTQEPDSKHGTKFKAAMKEVHAGFSVNADDVTGVSM